LLPVEERKIITDGGNPILFSANDQYDGHELNIDDYAAISRYLGAELEYTVRLLDNTPEDAADLVEYCNGDASTRYGALRIARGHQEAYNIKTWYIGNEVAFIADHKAAAELNDKFVEAMLKVDPTIKTVVTTGNNPDWDEKFLASAKMVDYCAQHSYIVEQIPNYDLSQVLQAAEGALYNKLEASCKRFNGKKMLLDEWNLRWGMFGDSFSGLYVAGVITMLIRNAEKLNLDGASYFALVNEGIVRVYHDHVILSPDGEIFKRMVEHVDGELELDEDSSYIKTIHDGYTFTSVLNKSATDEKLLTDIEGEYEIFTPNGENMNISKGNGSLSVIPPASVVFIKKYN